MKLLIEDLESFRANARARLEERRPEAEKLYKQGSEALKAALKQILSELNTEGDSIVQQMWTASSAQVAQIDEWTGSI